MILPQPVVQVLAAAMLDLLPRGLPDSPGVGGVPVDRRAASMSRYSLSRESTEFPSRSIARYR